MDAPTEGYGKSRLQVNRRDLGVNLVSVWITDPASESEMINTFAM